MGLRFIKFFKLESAGNECSGIM